jgi:mRNA interferase HigB
MRIISRRTLREFWSAHPQSEQPLRAWFAEASRADWQRPADIKSQYRNASIVGGNRVVFNIKGNDFRLVVKMNYPYRVAYIRFVGTHKQYDSIDVETV